MFEQLNRAAEWLGAIEVLDVEVIASSDPHKDSRDHYYLTSFQRLRHLLLQMTNLTALIRHVARPWSAILLGLLHPSNLSLQHTPDNQCNPRS